MLLRETTLLSRHLNNWILDLRFTTTSQLTGIELIFYQLVNGVWRLANTLDATPIKNQPKHRLLKAPLYKINGVPYIRYGQGSGHIGYFMDRFPDFIIHDAHPYELTDNVMDNVDSLYLSQAFTSAIERTPYQQDFICHWQSGAYWTGNDDTDLDLLVFTRRTQVPVLPPPPQFKQIKLF